MLSDSIIYGRIYNVKSVNNEQGYTSYLFDLDFVNYKGETANMSCETYSKKIAQVKAGALIACRGRKYKTDKPFAVTDYEELRIPQARTQQAPQQPQNHNNYGGGYGDDYGNLPW